jgi:hypothetical protein
LEDELKHFLSHWFAGYMDGLISLDAEQQDLLLSACGKACADSYTADRFRKAWEDVGENLPRFLAHLSDVFPEAEYTLVGENKIQVKYSHCACDLVTKGLVDNPMQCLCSLHNLKVNFEAAMDKDVKVVLQQSILSGDDQCCFEVYCFTRGY